MKRRLQFLVLAFAAASVVIPTVPPLLNAAVADPTPTVAITTDHASYVAGKVEQVTVVVAGAGSGKELRITAAFPNATTKVLAESDSVDDEGTFHFSYTVYVNHTLTADILDGTNVVATAHVTVAESAGLNTDVKGGYLGYSGAYAVFPKGSRPSFRSGDLTWRVANRCLRHEVQRLTSSGWVHAFTSPCRKEQKGVVVWKWLGKHPEKVRFRVRADFAGDVWNHAGHSPWQHFKIK
ncbi:MAG: hypothetical protein JWP74_3653 [Marmoricola sp.]|nr:hypothetical protein [Marmoricola sp.]